jgi:hypothetical protein
MRDASTRSEKTLSARSVRHHLSSAWIIINRGLQCDLFVIYHALCALLLLVCCCSVRWKWLIKCIALSHCSQSIEYFARATLMRRARSIFRSGGKGVAHRHIMWYVLPALIFFVLDAFFLSHQVIESLGALPFLFVPLSWERSPGECLETHAYKTQYETSGTPHGACESDFALCDLFLNSSIAHLQSVIGLCVCETRTKSELLRASGAFWGLTKRVKSGGRKFYIFMLVPCLDAPWHGKTSMRDVHMNGETDLPVDRQIPTIA